MACRILFPWSETESGPQPWKRQVPFTRLPWNSLHSYEMTYVQDYSLQECFISFSMTAVFHSFLKFYYFLYLWLCWVFVAVQAFSLVAANGAKLLSDCGAWAPHREGPSLRVMRASHREGSTLWGLLPLRASPREGSAPWGLVTVRASPREGSAPWGLVTARASLAVEHRL